MPMTLDQLKNQLSAIQPDESTYAGIGASEVPLLEQLLRDDEDWLAARAVSRSAECPTRELQHYCRRLVPIDGKRSGLLWR